MSLWRNDLNLEARKYELEVYITNLDTKRYKLEVRRFILTIITVCVTFLGATFSIYKYFDEAKKERRMNFKTSLSNINSSDITIQKFALRELSRYEDYYDESIPFIIGFYLECNDSTLKVIDTEIDQLIAVVGNPILRYIKDYTTMTQNADMYLQNIRMQILF